ncbi:MAG: glycerol-3-phosphate dehydrogenase/oxidase [Reichenbachiella sp.]
MQALKNRTQTLHSLQNEYFDIIIVGGGITGAGIALDAVTRGLKVALIEKEDFASGTSSKSTKLIHGGLRYLKQMEFSLVREVGQERAILHTLAPHLVRPEKMLFPLIKDGNYGKIMTSVGLMVYDVLADVEKEDQRKMLSPEETMALEPLLDQEIIEGGGIYAEYQTDDFRLVVENIKAAKREGARILNYVSCEEFLEKAGKICGIEAKDQQTGKSFQLYSDYVINAAGPWVDKIRGLQETVKGKKLHLTKGVHLVVPFEKLPIQQSVYFDVSDGRMIFAIPKKDVTYIGTTDTTYTQDPKTVTTELSDIEYLLKAVNDNFPSINLTIEDVKSSWAGLRPLIEEEGKSASEISRKDEIFVSEKGLVSIAGGKLTGYRKMAKRVVNEVLEIRFDKSAKNIPKCKTKKYRLPGNGFKSTKSVLKYKKTLEESHASLDAREVSYLVDLYGNQTEEIIGLYENREDKSILLAELDFSVHQEDTLHLSDFFIHRTGRLFFDVDSVNENLELIASNMQQILGWSDDIKAKEIENMKQHVISATQFV